MKKNRSDSKREKLEYIVVGVDGKNYYPSQNKYVCACFIKKGSYAEGRGQKEFIPSRKCPNHL